MGDVAALAAAAWAVRPTSPSCLRKVIRSTKPRGLDEETVAAPFVDRLVSELASRATLASSSSWPLATAPVPVATPPIAASSSLTRSLPSPSSVPLVPPRFALGSPAANSPQPLPS
uniref:Uncharacterized protein n=1 Tax=Oryza nivara TaxID=4536 RepID=A0A0E0FGM4_ORYNI